MAVTAAELQARFTSQGADQVKRDLTGVGGAVDAVKNKTSQWGQSLSQTGTWLKAGVTAPLAAFFTQAVFGASSLEQAQGKVESVFGSSADTIIAWADTTSRAIGVSNTQAMQWSGTVGNFFTSANIATDQAAKMSQEFVTLSADLGAFNDVSAARASDALISGLAGEYDALQRLGVNITAAKVDQEAMNIAMADGREEVTEADKALARYNVIMEESANQHGQFQKESKGFAGQLAILKARFSEVAASLGKQLMPYALQFVEVLRSLVERFGALSPGAQKFALIAAAVAAALGPLLIAIGLMLPGLGALAGLLAALLSPIGLVVAAAALLAFTFKDEIGAAITGLIDTVGEFVTTWQQMRDQGLSPVQAALAALQTMFPALGAVIAPLRQMVENLGDAFQAFRDGNFAEAFEALGRAAGNLGSAIMAAVRSIDWSGIGGALWDGLLGLAGWVGSQVLEIPSIVVDVLGWVEGKIADVWEWLKRTVVGGTGVSDGTGGATYGGRDVSLGEVTASVSGWIAGTIADVWAWLRTHLLSAKMAQDLGEVAVNVAGWGKGTIPNVAVKIKEWLGNVTTTLATVTLSILTFDPVYNGTAVDLLIEDMIGEVVVTLSDVAVRIAGFKFDTPAVTTMLQAAVPLIVGATVLSAVSISVPVLLTIGAIAMAVLAGFMIANWVSDWAQRNPVDAVRVLVNIALALGEITSKLPSKSELIEWVIKTIVPGGSLLVKIPALIEVNADPVDADPSGLPQPTGGEGPTIPTGNNSGLPDPQQPTGDFAGGGFMRSLAKLKAQIAAGLADIQTSTIQPKVTEWGTAMQAGLANLAGVAQAGFGGLAVPASVGLGAVTGAVQTGTAAQLGVATANWGAMLGSAITNFGGMLATGSSNASAMQAAVSASVAVMQANVSGEMTSMQGKAALSAMTMQTGVSTSASTMAANAGASALGMQLGVAMSMLLMKNSATSNASQMVSSLQTTFAIGMLGVRVTVSNAMNAIPGIIASAGGAAVSTATTVGRAIGLGVAAGLNSALGAVQAAASAIVNAANAAMAKAAVLGSPSKITTQYGRWIAEGLAIGMGQMTGDVARSADALALAAVPSLGGPAFGAALTPASAGGGPTSIVNHYTIAEGAIVVQDSSDPARTADAIMTRLRNAWADTPAIGRVR